MFGSGVSHLNATSGNLKPTKFFFAKKLSNSIPISPCHLMKSESPSGTKRKISNISLQIYHHLKNENANKNETVPIRIHSLRFSNHTKWIINITRIAILKLKKKKKSLMSSFLHTSFHYRNLSTCQKPIKKISQAVKNPYQKLINLWN